MHSTTHRLRRLRRKAGMLAITALVSVVAGCGSGGNSVSAHTSHPTTGNPGHAGKGTDGNSQRTTGNPVEPPTPGPQGSVSIPLSVAGSNGRSLLLTTVSVGGGPPVKVVVDTGSTGLVLDRNDLGPEAHPSGQSYNNTYVGFSVHGQIAHATVRFDDANQPLTTGAIGVADTPQLGAFATMSGAAGILGIGPGSNDPAQPPILSPLVQLPQPLAAGFSVQVNGPQGRLTLGSPTVTAASVKTPLTRAGFDYPDGQVAYEKDLQLCWTIATGHSCVPTTPDTGAFDGIVSTTLFPQVPAPGGQLATGTPVTITTPTGSPVCSFTASVGDQPKAQPYPVMNTGLRVFQAATVGYDLAAGQAVITPQPQGHC